MDTIQQAIELARLDREKLYSQRDSAKQQLETANANLKRLRSDSIKIITLSEYRRIQAEISDLGRELVNFELKIAKNIQNMEDLQS